MKRLILIQNDAPATGKTTLASCISFYLAQHGVDHQSLVLSESEAADSSDSRRHLEAEALTARTLFEHLDEKPISILEIETGLGGFFGEFYQAHDFENVLPEAGIQLSIVLPITTETESFESVLRCAEIYSDGAEYTIAHSVTSSYDDDGDTVWDRSYAARVMDMFEAVELFMPEVGFQLEMELRNHHVEVAEAILTPELSPFLGRDYTKWLSQCMAQVESARQYLFGDAFVPTSAPPSTKRRRTTRRAIG